MSSVRIKQIFDYLDIAEEMLNRGELTVEEKHALDIFIDEIQRTESIDHVRITKNGKSTLTLLKSGGAP